MRFANSLRASLRKSKIFCFSFLNQVFCCTCYFFDRHIWVHAMLIEEVDRIDLEPLERAGLLLALAFNDRRVFFFDEDARRAAEVFEVLGIPPDPSFIGCHELTHWVQSHQNAGLPVGASELGLAHLPEEARVTDASGFDARPGWVYLPPAYFAENPEPLPVLVLFHGQPGSPDDWITGDRVQTVMGAAKQLYVGLARLGSTKPLREIMSRKDDREPMRLMDQAAAWQVGNVLIGTPPPENGAHNRIAFKTGTSYGYRDAWAVGFDGKRTIGVWVGRPDGAPVTGLAGRTAAAPTGRRCPATIRSRSKTPPERNSRNGWSRSSSMASKRPSTRRCRVPMSPRRWSRATAWWASARRT